MWGSGQRYKLYVILEYLTVKMTISLMGTLLIEMEENAFACRIQADCMSS